VRFRIPRSSGPEAKNAIDSRANESDRLVAAELAHMVRKLDLHEDAMVRYCGSAAAIMGFEYAESARPIPVYADRRFRVDDHRQLQGIEYLREENRVLRATTRWSATSAR
jgi:hypothetical protein